jgi:hypothetical protein
MNTEADLEPNPALPARVEETSRVKRDQIGIGTNLHQALGIPLDDEVEVAETLPQPPYGERPVNRILQTRPAVCRVRRAVLPDPEFRVCRLPKSVMSLIGIEEGDRVVLESAWGRSTVRALEVTDGLQNKKRRMEHHNPNKYDVVSEKIEVGEPLGTPVDVPSIYIDYDTRDDLGILEQSADGTGVGQPVRVYRDNRAVFLQLIDDLMLPSFALLLSLLLLMERFLTFGQTVGLILLGFVVVVVLMLLQAVYRARRDI